MPILNDNPEQVKYYTSSNSAPTCHVVCSMRYICVTPEQLARFNHQRGNLSPAEYLDELLNVADGELPY